MLYHPVFNIPFLLNNLTNTISYFHNISMCSWLQIIHSIKDVRGCEAVAGVHLDQQQEAGPVARWPRAIWEPIPWIRGKIDLILTTVSVVLD